MTTLTFKLKDDQAALVRRRASQEQLTVSEYLRRRVLLPNPSPRKIKRVRCPHTGAMIFGAAPHLATLNTGVVREMLSEFP